MKNFGYAFPLIFVIFFTAGLAMGFTYPLPESSAAGPANISAPSSINTFSQQQEVNSPSKQLNVLVVGVEEVGSAKTRLLSLWLIIVPQGNSEITFMPIYPQPLGFAEGTFASAHEPVWVDAQSPESATILRLLAAEGTWWDEVALVDATGMTNLLELLGGSALYNEQSESALALNGSPSAWENPQAALEAQANLIKRVCEQSYSFAELLNPGTFVVPSPNHFLITTNKVDLFAVLYDMSASITGFGCQFPSLD